MSTPILDRPGLADGGFVPRDPGLERRQDPRKPRWPQLLLLAVCAGFVGGGALAGLLFAMGAIHKSATVTTVTSQRPASSTASGLKASTIYAAAVSGVVAISANVKAEVQTAYGPQSQTEVSSGTGSVLDTTGRILTAEHVVQDSTSITVKLADGTTRKAKILGKDSATDVAILKINPAGLTLHPLALGSLRSLRIGDPVLVIGDPFGYPRSLSVGVVSGLGRTIVAPNGFMVSDSIQTDAAINPGNSGGPLLDAQGLVIGVADQIATGGTGVDTNTGVGFAVPVDAVKSVLPALERGATPEHAYLGVSSADATSRAGARVQTVKSGSPAAKAGVKAGDVVVSFGNVKIEGVSDLVAAIAAHHPGDHVTLTVVRGGKQLSLGVDLTKQPTQAASG